MSIKKKKVLFIIPSLVWGGAERVLVNLLSHFDFSRFEVTLCVVYKRGVYFNQIPQEAKLIILFNNAVFAKALSKLHTLFQIDGLYKWIVQRRIKGNFDVGISFLDSSYTDLLFFLNPKIQKKITWIHGSYKSNPNYSTFLKGKYLNRVIASRYAKLDKIMIVSNDARDEFTSILGNFDNLEVLYNFMDSKSIRLKAAQAVQEVFEKDKINIIAVGSLLPVKGYDTLLHAAYLLKKDGIAFKLRIVGDGKLKDELIALIQSLNISDVVSLMGFKDNPYPYILQSDIYVMSSISEALPTALIESMILGLPVVVTNCSGCKEIVDNGEYGIMTENYSTTLFEGLKEIIIDSEKRALFKLKSLERAKLFSDDKILSRIYEILDS